MKTMLWKAVFGKIRLSVLLVCACCAMQAQAQDIQHQRGDDLKEYLPDSVKFVVPEYTAGFVKFRDGSFARGPVNISTIEQRIYFVNPEGEVQVLVNEDQVSYVTFAGRTFIKSRYGYVEPIDKAGDISLGVVRRVSFLESKKTGAFGTNAETSSVTSVSSIYDSGLRYTLGVNQDTPYRYKVIPYLLKGEKVLLSNKKNLLKCFPDRKDFIEGYLKEHAVDFEKTDDVTALFEALKQASL
ncbi:MAG: hypothetical protein II068_02020 [Bacteroidales bacterium]|nr:hypothetical protein [Bacteroidales bacterium]MBQ2195186.1 hypothetical protein [Bacteroidales bacterium]